jgi:hypothetical protein
MAAALFARVLAVGAAAKLATKAARGFVYSVKNERVHGSRYEPRDEAKTDLFDYIEVFHNRRRRRGAPGGVSPISRHRS